MTREEFIKQCRYYAGIKAICKEKGITEEDFIYKLEILNLEFPVIIQRGANDPALLRRITNALGVKLSDLHKKNEELTAQQHTEFFDDPKERENILIMEAYARIKRGEPKEEVLQGLGLSISEYDDRVKTVLPYLSKEIGKLRYWGNSWDECVVREDEQGNRYIKHIGQDRESLAPAGSMAAYGGIGYGEYHLLEAISEERYLTFGKSWYYGKDGEIIDRSNK